MAQGTSSHSLILFSSCRWIPIHFPSLLSKKAGHSISDCKPTIPLSHCEKIKSALSVAHKCEGESAALPAATPNQTHRISNAVNGKSFPNRSASVNMREHFEIVSLIPSLSRLSRVRPQLPQIRHKIQSIITTLESVCVKCTAFYTHCQLLEHTIIHMQNISAQPKKCSDQCNAVNTF